MGTVWNRIDIFLIYLDMIPSSKFTKRCGQQWLTPQEMMYEWWIFPYHSISMFIYIILYNHPEIDRLFFFPKIFPNFAGIFVDL